jgi:antirestriction protein ArdC
MKIEDVIKAMGEAGDWDPKRMDHWFAFNPLTTNRYRGMNRMVLYITGIHNEYASNKWITFNQAKRLGGMVKKGEHGTKILFYDGDKTIKWYTVFNVMQVDGLGAGFYGFEPPYRSESLDALVDKYIAHAGVSIVKSDGTPYYSQKKDEIGMPNPDSFTDSGYYEAMIHEMAHSTKHPDRLNRELKYAVEEIVAEFSTAELLIEAGMEDALKNMAAYMKGWWGHLNNNSRDLALAISKAEEALGYIRGVAA